MSQPFIFGGVPPAVAPTTHSCISNEESTSLSPPDLPSDGSASPAQPVRKTYHDFQFQVQSNSTLVLPSSIDLQSANTDAMASSNLPKSSSSPPHDPQQLSSFGTGVLPKHNELQSLSSFSTDQVGTANTTSNVQSNENLQSGDLISHCDLDPTADLKETIPDASITASSASPEAKPSINSAPSCSPPSVSQRSQTASHTHQSSSSASVSVPNIPVARKILIPRGPRHSRATSTNSHTSRIEAEKAHVPVSTALDLSNTDQKHEVSSSIMPSDPVPIPTEPYPLLKSLPTGPRYPPTGPRLERIDRPSHNSNSSLTSISHIQPVDTQSIAYQSLDTSNTDLIDSPHASTATQAATTSTSSYTSFKKTRCNPPTGPAAHCLSTKFESLLSHDDEVNPREGTDAGISSQPGVKLTLAAPALPNDLIGTNPVEVSTGGLSPLRSQEDNVNNTGSRDQNGIIDANNDPQINEKNAKINALQKEINDCNTKLKKLITSSVEKDSEISKLRAKLKQYTANTKSPAKSVSAKKITIKKCVSDLHKSEGETSWNEESQSQALGSPVRADTFGTKFEEQSEMIVDQNRIIKDLDDQLRACREFEDDLRESLSKTGIHIPYNEKISVTVLKYLEELYQSLKEAVSATNCSCRPIERYIEWSSRHIRTLRMRLRQGHEAVYEGHKSTKRSLNSLHGEQVETTCGFPESFAPLSQKRWEGRSYRTNYLGHHGEGCKSDTIRFCSPIQTDTNNKNTPPSRNRRPARGILKYNGAKPAEDIQAPTPQITEATKNEVSGTIASRPPRIVDVPKEKNVPHTPSIFDAFKFYLLLLLLAMGTIGIWEYFEVTEKATSAAYSLGSLLGQSVTQFWIWVWKKLACLVALYALLRIYGVRLPNRYEASR